MPRSWRGWPRWSPSSTSHRSDIRFQRPSPASHTSACGTWTLMRARYQCMWYLGPDPVVRCLPVATTLDTTTRPGKRRTGGRGSRPAGPANRYARRLRSDRREPLRASGTVLEHGAKAGVGSGCRRKRLSEARDLGSSDAFDAARRPAGSILWKTDRTSPWGQPSVRPSHRLSVAGRGSFARGRGLVHGGGFFARLPRCPCPTFLPR
jgi:hypothetical protein